MSQRVALVTGGTRGIGKAIAIALKNAGRTVAANYSGNDDAARAFTAETGIPHYKFDVGDFAAVQDAVARITKDLGPIDILVNNAGITRDGFLHKMQPSQWSDVLRTNLDSVFNTTRQFITGMRERGFGRIVNISSINGQKGQFGQTNYSAAKAGLIGFTKALAAESAGKGITVNCICPGYISTEMTAAIDETVREGIIAGIPVGRMGTPEEIAAAVRYAVSLEAAFMTGAVMSINGGQYMANC